MSWTDPGSGDPQREPVRAGDCLDVAAVMAALAGVPQVDGLAFHAGGLLPAPVRRDDLAVQDHECRAFGQGAGQGLRQLRGPGSQHSDHLVHVPVSSSPRDAMIGGQRPNGCAVAEPAQAQHRLPEAGQHPAPARSAPAAPLRGQQAGYAGSREKTVTTVLGPVLVMRAWYHCAGCGRGFAPRDKQLGVAGTSLSPGLAEMIARPARRCRSARPPSWWPAWPGSR
jgi:hypothetical protein